MRYMMVVRCFERSYCFAPVIPLAECQPTTLTYAEFCAVSHNAHCRIKADTRTGALYKSLAAHSMVFFNSPFGSVDTLVLLSSHRWLRPRTESSSDDMALPTSEPGTNQEERLVYFRMENHDTKVPLTVNVHRTGLEEFACIDTTSDPLHYSTGNGGSSPMLLRTIARCEEGYSSLKHVIRLTRSIVADCPPGYPMLARFTASAPQFYVFREFRYLQSRTLLHLQDEIRALEAQLWRMDEKDRANKTHNLQCRELDDTSNGLRKIMMERIQHKLVQYGE